MANYSIVIVSYNTVDYLHECLSSLYTCCAEVPEVIVVDNASADGSCEMVEQQFPQVELIKLERNLGFGGANNIGVSKAKHPYVVLLNSDAFLKTDTPQLLVAYLASHSEVSCICPRVVLPKTMEIQAKTFGFNPTAKRVWMQSLGLNRIFPKLVFFQGTDGDYRWAEEMEVGWVSGVCMAMRTQQYLSVGGFDTRFFMYCEDVALCMKLASYGKIILYDTAEIVHYGGASSKSLAAKIRNGLWQQRHLLMIVQDNYGSLSTFSARLALLCGAIIRVTAAIPTIFKRGIANNEALQIGWARLIDLLRVHKQQKVAS